MPYLIKGRLCGSLCRDCSEPIANATVKIYQTVQSANLIAEAVAEPKETFRYLDIKQVDAKAQLLLAEGLTDAEGNFSIQLDKNYEGQAFDIDFVCGSVPRVIPKPRKKEFEPRQFHLTTILPKWKYDDNQNLVYSLDYCLPDRFWCYILGYFFDIWTICGRLTDCKTGRALPGFDVTAMDADFFTDDVLGTATTDASGYFRISYSSADFKRTFLSPVVNIETDPGFPFTSGPDVYFKLAYGGTPIVLETKSDRRTNVGYCLCVRLCVDEPVIVDPPIPATFTHIGRSSRYRIQDDINALTGKTVADGRAFYNSLVLIGTLNKKLSGLPMEYIFEYQEVASPSTAPSGVWQAVTPGMIRKTTIGQEWAFTGDIVNPIQWTPWNINGTLADGGVVTFNGNWIQVPQMPNFAANVNSDILVLDTEKIILPTTLDMAGMSIGAASVSGARPHIRNRYVVIRMRQRQVGNPASEVVAGTSRALAIFNVRYDNVPKHGSWAPATVDGQMGVASVDIREIMGAGAGCSKISAGLTVLYSARNENLGNVTVSITGPTKPGQTISFPAIPASAAPETVGSVLPIITPINDVRELLPCAYTIHLHAELLLTTGDGVPSPLTDFVSFCKV